MGDTSFIHGMAGHSLLHSGSWAQSRYPHLSLCTEDTSHSKQPLFQCILLSPCRGPHSFGIWTLPPAQRPDASLLCRSPLKGQVMGEAPAPSQPPSTPHPLPFHHHGLPVPARPNPLLRAEQDPTRTHQCLGPALHTMSSCLLSLASADTAHPGEHAR